jgi:hypothetical protein
MYLKLVKSYLITSHTKSQQQLSQLERISGGCRFVRSQRHFQSVQRIFVLAQNAGTIPGADRMQERFILGKSPFIAARLIKWLFAMVPVPTNPSFIVTPIPP